jgi:prepilin-type N-terminal cleavage/methylation domain-containing protein/prepilin-type processing-associated H-X9-DG protein
MSARLTLGGRARRCGFTLVELLVVMAVISILATLLMPAVLKGMTGSRMAQCMSNLKQIGQTYQQYVTAWDSWLIVAGNYDNMHDKEDPILEAPWLDDWNRAWEADPDAARNFPYWYESIQPYAVPGITPDELKKEYEKMYGTSDRPTYEDGLPKWKKYVMAKLCRLFACPEWAYNYIGYGYNYVAPFGNPSCYGDGDGQVSKFRWPYRGNYKNYPCKSDNGHRWMIPILWYSRSVRQGVITTPSQQILMCDVGFVANAYHDVARTDPTHPSEWIDKNKFNFQGYVRFPLNTTTMDGLCYQTSRFWPMPRHGNRVCCLFFDGSVSSAPIMDVVGPRWGDPHCMFDNIPPSKPPVSALAEHVELDNDGL